MCALCPPLSFTPGGNLSAVLAPCGEEGRMLTPPPGHPLGACGAACGCAGLRPALIPSWCSLHIPLHRGPGAVDFPNFVPGAFGIPGCCTSQPQTSLWRGDEGPGLCRGALTRFNALPPADPVLIARWKERHGPPQAQIAALATASPAVTRAGAQTSSRCGIPAQASFMCTA